MFKVRKTNITHTHKSKIFPGKISSVSGEISTAVIHTGAARRGKTYIFFHGEIRPNIFRAQKSSFPPSGSPLHPKISRHPLFGIFRPRKIVSISALFRNRRSSNLGVFSPSGAFTQYCPIN